MKNYNTVMLKSSQFSRKWNKFNAAENDVKKKAALVLTSFETNYNISRVTSEHTNADWLNFDVHGLLWTKQFGNIPRPQAPEMLTNLLKILHIQQCANHVLPYFHSAYKLFWDLEKIIIIVIQK
jgi:hypothetical protein